MVIYKAAEVLCIVYSDFLIVNLEIRCAYCSIEPSCQGMRLDVAEKGHLSSRTLTHVHGKQTVLMI